MLSRGQRKLGGAGTGDDARGPLHAQPPPALPGQYAAPGGSMRDGPQGWPGGGDTPPRAPTGRTGPTSSSWAASGSPGGWGSLLSRFSADGVGVVAGQLRPPL